MAETGCRPCKCGPSDAILSVFYIFIIMGSATIVCVIQLDQELNENRCDLINMNLNITPDVSLKLPDVLNNIVCNWFVYITATLIAAAFLFIITNWVCGCSELICWWIIQLCVCILSAVITLAIGVVLTTMLVILCGQLNAATNESSCISAVSRYDRLKFEETKNSDSVVQIVFDHRVVAVTATWFTFFSWFLACFVILLRTCHTCYHRKLDSLLRVVEDVRQANRREAVMRQTRTTTVGNPQSSYIDDDPPPHYDSLLVHSSRTAPDEEPLIRF